MKRLSFLCLASLLFFASGCVNIKKTPSDPTVTFTEADGTSLTLKAGQSFAIELGGNITTGFRWRASKENENQGIVKFLREDYKTKQSDPTLAGAPGNHYFYYRAEEPGECILRFEYLRPWEEKDPSLLKTREYQITVE